MLNFIGFLAFSANKKSISKAKHFVTTILAKIYETNFSVSARYRTTGKVQFRFFNSFLLVLTKFSFLEEHWALGYNSMKF